MPVVTLDFIPPIEPDITKLHIYESISKDGPWNEIEMVSAVGTYPNYITRYVSDQANSPVDFFAISWENSLGEESELSAPVQGGTTTLAGILVQRMMLRDSTLNEVVASQEAEAAISDFYGVLDPSTIDPDTVSPKLLSGLTNLALARSYITKQITTSTANKWTAGIVSMDTSSSGAAQSTETIKALLDLANRDLGRSYSVILLMKEIEVGDHNRQLVSVDVSRSIYELE